MKILFISYFFPPNAHAGAVERTVFIIRELVKRGHRISVLTARNYTFFKKDNSFQKVIPSDVHVFSPSAIEPSTFFSRDVASLSSKRGFLRYLIWPDSRVFWLINAVPSSIKLVKNFKPDLIVSIAPPYTDLLLGYFLSKRFKIPLVVDLLDPWSDDLYEMYPSQWQKKLTHFAERLILESAKGGLVATYPMKWRLLERYDFLKPEKIENITYGIIEENVEKIREINFELPFTVLYLGTIRGGHKNPVGFVKGFSRFVSKNKDAMLHLVGSIEKSAAYKFESLIPKENLKISPYLANEEIYKVVNESHLLWLLISKAPGFELVMPAKTIAYLGFKRPILATVPAGWTARFLSSMGIKVVDPDDEDSIERALQEFYDSYKKRQLITPPFDRVREFYYDKIGERYENFIKRVI